MIIDYGGLLSWGVGKIFTMRGNESEPFMTIRPTFVCRDGKEEYVTAESLKDGTLIAPKIYERVRYYPRAEIALVTEG